MSLEMPTEEWKNPTADFHLDPTKIGTDTAAFEQVVRETAIEGAEMSELQEAVDRMTAKLQDKPGDAKTVEALARVRAQIDALIQKSQN